VLFRSSIKTMAKFVSVKFHVESVSVATRNMILNICSNRNIKIVKIHEKPKWYLVVFSTADDADKIFDDDTARLFAASNVTPVMPSELKAKRSIIIKRVDSIIFSESESEIKSTIEEANFDIIVTELFKFKSTPGIKVTFSSSSMAIKVLLSGIYAFKLYIPPSEIQQDDYIFIQTCYTCYDKLRQEAIKNKRNGLISQKQTKNSYAAAATPNSSPRLSENSTSAKTMTCIMLSVIKNEESSKTFEETLNYLLKLNNLPTIRIGNYKPPSSNEIFPSRHNDITQGNQGNSKESVADGPAPEIDKKTGPPLPPHAARSRSQTTAKASTSSSSGTACARKATHLDLPVNLRIYRNYQAIRSGEELAEATRRGNAVITDDNYRTLPADVIANICADFAEFRNRVESVKVDELKKIKENMKANINFQ